MVTKYISDRVIGFNKTTKELQKKIHNMTHTICSADVSSSKLLQIGFAVAYLLVYSSSRPHVGQRLKLEQQPAQQKEAAPLPSNQQIRVHTASYPIYDEWPSPAIYSSGGDFRVNNMQACSYVDRGGILCAVPMAASQPTFDPVYGRYAPAPYLVTDYCSSGLGSQQLVTHYSPPTESSYVSQDFKFIAAQRKSRKDGDSPRREFLSDDRRQLATCMGIKLTEFTKYFSRIENRYGQIQNAVRAVEAYLTEHGYSSIAAVQDPHTLLVGSALARILKIYEERMIPPDIDSLMHTARLRV